MFRTAYSLLLAALLVVPSLAAEPTPEDLRKQIDDLRKVTEDLNKLKVTMKIVDELRSKTITHEALIEMLEKDIKDIKKKIGMDGVNPSTSLKPDTTANAFKGQGRVRFINAFSEEMSVVVNGRSYRLLPGDEKVVPVPPGEFTYQVLQIQRTAQDRQIAADEVKTVTIYPIK